MPGGDWWKSAEGADAPQDITQLNVFRKWNTMAVHWCAEAVAGFSTSVKLYYLSTSILASSKKLLLSFGRVLQEVTSAYE